MTPSPAWSHACSPSLISFFFTDTATTEIYTLSLHDALPIWALCVITLYFPCRWYARLRATLEIAQPRSEEHTSELQSRFDLVCRLLLEKKKQRRRRRGRSDRTRSGGRTAPAVVGWRSHRSAV